MKFVFQIEQRCVATVKPKSPRVTNGSNVCYPVR